VTAAGLWHITTHRLRHTYATAQFERRRVPVSPRGHPRSRLRRNEPALRHPFDTTIGAGYERSLDLAETSIGVRPPRGTTPSSEPDTLDWRTTETIKLALACGTASARLSKDHAYMRTAAKHYPGLHNTSDYIPVLTQQRADATALADDATGRGWDSVTSDTSSSSTESTTSSPPPTRAGRPCNRSHEDH
jgi:hypothetical protein